MEPLKNIMVAGASGTIGAPIVAALLASGSFKVSALSRPSSKAIFPVEVTIKRADLTSHAALVEAFRDQDAVLCTMNDETAPLQAGIIEAAFEAGVKRFFPNEWSSHAMAIPGTPLVDVMAGKNAIVELLDQKVQEGKRVGKEFHWTGINNGLFFDWALQVGFLDITLPPTKTARFWDSGANLTTCTTLSTVCKAVVATLTFAEEATRDRLVNIQSFVTSQNEIVMALERATGEKWAIEKTTTEKQLALADEFLKRDEFLPAFYIWVNSYAFSGHAVLTEVENELLGLEAEDLQGIINAVVNGKDI